MSKQQLESFLTLALARLEKMEAQIQMTQGYTEETEKIRMLKELVKEQIQNEDPDHTARAIR